MRFYLHLWAPPLVQGTAMLRVVAPVESTCVWCFCFLEAAPFLPPTSALETCQKFARLMIIVDYFKFKKLSGGQSGGNLPGIPGPGICHPPPVGLDTVVKWRSSPMVKGGRHVAGFGELLAAHTIFGRLALDDCQLLFLIRSLSPNCPKSPKCLFR